MSTEKKEEKVISNTGSDIQKKLRPMIDLIDELRENGVNSYISLPSIVVVGDQSRYFQILLNF